MKILGHTNGIKARILITLILTSIEDYVFSYLKIFNLLIIELSKSLNFLDFLIIQWKKQAANKLCG